MKKVFVAFFLMLMITGTVGSSDGSDARLRQDALPADDAAKMTEWFSQPTDQRGAIPSSLTALPPLSRDSAQAIQAQVWQAYKQGAIVLGKDKILPPPTPHRGKRRQDATSLEIRTGDKTMPFVFLDKQTQGDEKRPLFIALHGGGSAGGAATTPHGWAVNTSEWQAQIHLAARLYPSNSLYFVPRMADDNDGRWYYDYCQDAYTDVIRQAILFHHVDPNRIYLIGISEGAYTAYRLGSFMADRWAGAGSMAGGEPLENAPPENMRNLAFRADIGERDTMFDRVGLNRRFGDELTRLQAADPAGYHFEINVQADRGHGINYQPCPAWLYQFERNPWPTRVTWKVIQVHQRYQKQFYWLALDQPPATFPLLLDAQADRQTNIISLTAHTPGGTEQPPSKTKLPAMRVYLNDQLVDLDLPVTILCNQRQVFHGKVPRRVPTMMRSLAERGDPSFTFPAEVVINAENAP